MEAGSVGGASSMMFQQVAAMQQAPEKNAVAMQQEMQQMQKQMDQNRIESAKASGSSVGTNVNTYAWGFFLQKGCLETNTFLFLKICIYINRYIIVYILYIYLKLWYQKYFV